MVQLLIDTRYLLDPGATLVVFQLHNLFHRPVEVICDVGYLFTELLFRVARYSPDGTSSTSNCVLHLGHWAGMVACSDSLMRR